MEESENRKSISFKILDDELGKSSKVDVSLERKPIEIRNRNANLTAGNDKIQTPSSQRD
jgi:hypothetical protein